MPQTTNVSNARELNTALQHAAGGDTIVLKAGNYGALKLSGADYATNVTITSEAPLAAKFTSVDLTDVDHLSFKGVTVTGEVRADGGSEAIVLARSDVNGGVYFQDSRNITLKLNDITTKGVHAAIFNDTDVVTIANNVIHDARSDLLRITGDSSGYQVRGNELLDTHSKAGDHPDLVQVMATGGVTPSNLSFLGNVLYDDPTTGGTAPAQGFFISLPAKDGYKNILIEDNLVATTSPNGIFINGGKSNVLVHDNVLPTVGGGGGSIRMTEMGGVSNGGTTIEHNVARQVLDETTGLSNGHQVGANTLKSIPVADLLANWNAHIDGSFASVPHDFGMADLNIA